MKQLLNIQIYEFIMTRIQENYNSSPKIKNDKQITKPAGRIIKQKTTGISQVSGCIVVEFPS